MRKYEKKKWIIFIYLKNNVANPEQMEFLTDQIIDAFRGDHRYAVVLSEYVDKIEFVPKSTWTYILMKILRILHDLIRGKKYAIKRN